MANRCFPYHAIASLTHRHTDIQRDTHVCRSPLRERVFLPDYTPVFYGVLGFAPGHFPCKNAAGTGVGVPTPSRFIASVFVGARLAMSLAPPALRLAFSKSFPCFRNSLVTSEEGVVAYKHNDYEAYGHGAGSQNISLKALRRGSDYARSLSTIRSAEFWRPGILPNKCLAQTESSCSYPQRSSAIEPDPFLCSPSRTRRK